MKGNKAPTGIFAGEVAVITGAGQGIGYEIARQLTAQGAAVLLNDQDPDLAMLSAGSLREAGGRCEAFPGDAGDPACIQGMVEAAVAHWGHLTLAIANAGLSHYGDFFACTPVDFEQITRLNLGGTFFLAQAAARQMRLQGRGGSLLLMSSVTGHQALAHLSAYAMTKAGIEMLARNLVAELSPYQITVNALAPGATLTERTRQFQTYETGWSTFTPMGRPATVADIAHAALFLLAPQTRHITGQTLIVDGGWTAISPLPPEP
ncbi:MAG: SDR family oxidoreductase [Bacteroidia bacterium]|nr:SDR family oxidoreductase [Bacteroidia bacterium]